jgi:toxin-antitoxin system PIN domain toxin
MKKMLLPDINVWLAFAFDEHTNHLAAKNWFDEQSDETIYFCRLTQQGFLRLATNSKVVGNRAVSMNDAWKLYDTFLTDSRVRFAVEPPDIEMVWRGLSQATAFSPNAWSDAYLAAFAISHGCELITFDRGFGKFNGLNWTRLS